MGLGWGREQVSAHTLSVWGARGPVDEDPSAEALWWCGLVFFKEYEMCDSCTCVTVDG